MEKEKDQEMNEFIEEFADDFTYGQKTEQLEVSEKTSGGAKGGRMVLLIGILCLIILGGLAAFVWTGTDGQTEEQLLNIQSKMAQIEMRLARIERMEDKSPQREKQERDFQKALDEKARAFKDWNRQLEDLKKRVENLAQMSTKPKAPPRPATAVREEGPASPQRLSHEVKRGETLYRISRKYGVSIPQLRTWNGLSPDDFIKPGQTLWVSSGKNQ